MHWEISKSQSDISMLALPVKNSLCIWVLDVQHVWHQKEGASHLVCCVLVVKTLRGSTWVVLNQCCIWWINTAYPWTMITVCWGKLHLSIELIDISTPAATRAEICRKCELKIGFSQLLQRATQLKSFLQYSPVAALVRFTISLGYEQPHGAVWRLAKEDQRRS